MDRKSIIIVIACIGLLVGWNMLVNKLYPPKPVVQSVTGSNAVATAQPALTNATGTSAPASLTAAAATSIPFVAETNAPEQLLVITNENARYTFTSHGGGLQRIEVLGVSTRKERKLGEIPTLNLHATAPTLGILDGEAVQGNGFFHLTQTGNSVRAEKQLPNGLAIIKQFDISSNYLVTATVRLENQSTQTLTLPEQKWLVGTASPMNPEDNGTTTVGWMWYNGEKAADTVGGSYFSSHGFACMPKTPPAEFRVGQSNVVWVAAHNQFFALALMPQDHAGQVYARPIPLAAPTAAELQKNSRLNKEPKAYEVAMAYPPVTLVPKQALERHFTIFAGPKEWQTLATIAARFNNNLDAVMGFGFFGFVSKALLLGMNWLNSALSLPYGWAIIAITVIIKCLFWPLTAASTRSMKRMQLLQPQMKAIAEKYKDDPLKKNQKTMEFMKQNKVSPLGGCLPMLLQMPVFFGFFTMIRSAIELRGASFLWVADLSRPDTLFMIPGLNFPFNPLPLIMGGTMLWQAHLTPPSPGMDPMQQKIMRYMPLMFMVFLYNYSAGLALYWTVNNLLTILQTKLTKTMTAPASPAPILTQPPKKRK